MDTLLPPHPLHLATLGLLDNEIGAATLGYIVGPPVVPRFPSEATVQEMAWLARVSPEADWEAKAQSCNWGAVLDPRHFELDGLFESSFYRATVESHGEFEAMVRQQELAGAVEVVEESAVVQPGGSVGAVEDGAESATVQEAVPAGSVQDKPGEGCC